MYGLGIHGRRRKKHGQPRRLEAGMDGKGTPTGHRHMARLRRPPCPGSTHRRAVEDLEYEVAILLRKVQASEDVVARAQAYYDNYSHQWSDGVCGWFQDVLEQKR